MTTENTKTAPDEIVYACRKVTITCASMRADDQDVLVEAGRYTVSGLLLTDGRLLTLNAMSGDSLWSSLEDYTPIDRDTLVSVEESDETEELSLESLTVAAQRAVDYGNDSLLTDEEWNRRPWPRSFTMSMADGGSEDIECESLEAAKERMREWAREGDYGFIERTIWVDWTLSTYDKNGHNREVASGTVTIDPDESCSHEKGHDWRSPYSLLGGLKENPGVWGHGGGAIIKEVCVRCGCQKTTDTWAQRPDNGVQGLTSVSYETSAHVISNELEAIRWESDGEDAVGVWCDRWFVRGEENGAFDTEAEARAALAAKRQHEA